MYDESALLEALAVVIRKHGNYDDANVSVGNHRILDSGLSFAVVVEAGPIASDVDEQYGYMAGVTSVYNFVAYVYRRYTYDAETRENLRDDVQIVRTTIDGYYRLNGNAESCKVVAASDPVYIAGQDGSGPFFLVRRLTVRVMKIEALTTSE